MDKLVAASHAVVAITSAIRPCTVDFQAAHTLERAHPVCRPAIPRENPSRYVQQG